MSTNRLNLMLHCGGNEVDFDAVTKVNTPAKTDTWCPIPHHEYVNTVLDTLRQANLKVVHEAHALWKDGNRYFGTFQLENGVSHDDYALVVGLRNSHDKTFPAGLACGSGVFVCDNLAFSGEVRLSRKHTSRIMSDLPRLVNTAVGRLGNLRVNQEKRIECYKGREITDLEAHDLLVRSVDAKALPITRLPGVVEEWRKPSHDEFKPRTAWSLFNAYTEVFKGNKGTSADRMSARTIPLHGLFDNLCGLTAETEELEDAEIVGGVPALN